MTDRARPRRPRTPAPPTPIGLSKGDAGDRIQAAREAAGLTRAEAAARLAVSYSRIVHVETGRKVLTWPRLLHWMLALDLDPRIVLPELFEGE